MLSRLKMFIMYWKTKIVDMASSWKLQKQLFLKNEHSKLPKDLETKEKAGISQPAVCIGDAMLAVYE